MRFSHNSPDGREICAIKAEHFWGGVHGLIQIVLNKDIKITASNWIELLEKAITSLKETKAETALMRLVIDENSNELSERLSSIGMELKHKRVEYRALLKDLPSGMGSAITWSNMAESDWSLEQIAELLEQVAHGDPDYDPNESALACMEDWLKDPVLNSGRQCIEIGELDGIPMALVVAQINPKSGWSRISYMGMLAEYRGKGLGTWVHRKGFDMMRAQGGILYHGGTHSDNNRMRALFTKHGCNEYRQMEEWIFKFG